MSICVGILVVKWKLDMISFSSGQKALLMFSVPTRHTKGVVLFRFWQNMIKSLK